MTQALNKKFWQLLVASTMTVLILINLTSCDEKKNAHQIKFSTNATYPPFEFIEKGQLVGFDIDLAKAIAVELGKEAVFEDMQFQNLLPAIDKNMSDAAISTLTITAERKKNFDFSIPYYDENLAVVYPKNKPITTIAQMSSKKAACQIATTVEIWLKKYAPQSPITIFDDNNQAIESLKAGHIDFVMIDGVQALAFTKNNPTLGYKIITKSENGYGIALKKNSPLTAEINQALKNLIAKGKIQELEKKWIN